jgi:hypothetical protein
MCFAFSVSSGLKGRMKAMVDECGLRGVSSECETGLYEVRTAGFVDPILLTKAGRNTRLYMMPTLKRGSVVQPFVVR